MSLADEPAADRSIRQPTRLEAVAADGLQAATVVGDAMRCAKIAPWDISTFTQSDEFGEL